MKMMLGLGDAKIGNKTVCGGLMNCELQAFRFDMSTRNTGPSYRFAVVDYSKAQQYPANFVCMLPLKIEFSKGKHLNTFGVLFGEKSTNVALELLNKALLHEQDSEIKIALEKRIRLLDPKKPLKMKCGSCRQIFESKAIRKYKHPLCTECYRKRFYRK